MTLESVIALHVSLLQAWQFPAANIIYHPIPMLFYQSKFVANLLAKLCALLEIHGMRLINTATLEFEEFFAENTPRYAILSHRWSNSEISYKDFLKRRKTDSLGYAKIVKFCTFARDRNFEWCWIDTCCIDKKSSAELTEAINSMYQWYEDASGCFAYISDLHPARSIPDEDRMDAFRKSVWFTRGWTLQELLAPKDVTFCDSDWAVYGTKSGLAEEISSITGIPSSYLRHKDAPQNASIATKMSWISKRHTTRVEDMAYCLLGLFEVNMPLLYGERQKAFMRLQLEIIKKSDDESIFAWTASSTDQIFYGMLAPNPQAFQKSGAVHSDPGSIVAKVGGYGAFYTMTNKGLEIRMPSYMRPDEPHSVVIRLRCYEGSRSLVVNLVERVDGRWNTFRESELDEADVLNLKLDLVETRIVVQKGL